MFPQLVFVINAFLLPQGFASLKIPVQLSEVMASPGLPKVSVITLNSRLRKDLQWNVLANFLKQDYTGPTELLVVDAPDRQQEVTKNKNSKLADQFSNFLASFPNVVQVFRDEHANNLAQKEIRLLDGTGLCTGTMRNLAVESSQGDIIVNMDDDDCYGADYISRIVTEFQKNLKTSLVYQEEQVVHQINIDGSMGTKGDVMNPYIGNGHAFRKNLFPSCKYSKNWVTEEQSFVDCIKNTTGAEMKPISTEPSDGVGLHKLAWEGSVCSDVWRTNLEKQLDSQMSFNAFMSYRAHVKRTLHMLQYSTGGFQTMKQIRSALTPQQQSAVPTLKIASDKGMAKTSECQSWNIFVRMPHDDMSPATSGLDASLIPASQQPPHNPHYNYIQEGL